MTPQRMDIIRKVDMRSVLLAIKSARQYLTNQQYRTLRGQALSGDLDGALRGLSRIMIRRFGNKKC